MWQQYLTIACLSATVAADFPLLQNLHMPCPVVDCVFVFCPSGQYTQNYMTINGHKCPSCRTCEETSLKARQLQSLLQMPCPIVDCMYLSCPSGQYKQNYMTINGKQCPSCASCVDSAKVARHIEPDLMECPLYHCMVPKCSRGQFHEGYTLVNGHECPACPICTEFPILTRVQNEVDEQAGFTCPSPMCVASETCNNAHLVDSYYKFRGHQCPGCSVCEKNIENTD